METKKRMEAEMKEAGEIIKARKEEKLARLTSVSRYGVGFPISLSVSKAIAN